MTYTIAIESDESITDCSSLGLSKASSDLNKKCEDLHEHFTIPISREEALPIVKFYTLKEQWESETRICSSISDIALHPAYQQIIGMGEIAVSFILSELAFSPGHWFWALSSITGENPVLPKNMGNIKKMTSDWLQWGKRNGYS